MTLHQPNKTNKKQMNATTEETVTPPAPAAPTNETRVVLTRNFHGKTKATYCVAKFGETPEQAKEVEEIELEDVGAVHVTAYKETRGFQSFGCGLVIVGHLPSKQSLESSGGKKIKWNGFGFEYAATGKTFNEAARLVATDVVIEVWE